MSKIKYYSLDEILKRNALYNVIFGERSNGKTFAVKHYGFKDYCENGHQLAIIRRWETDIKGKSGAVMFDDLIALGYVEKYTKGKYNTIVYYSRSWYLARVEDGEKVSQDEKPFAYAFAISQDEHYKSTSYPNIRTIFFDEFLTRDYYLPDEFIKFTSIVSTIVRLRDDVKIFMCGNTVNKSSIYFNEMGLTNVKKQLKGTIDLYSYGDSGLTVAVEYSDFPTKQKKSNKYFAFNNPKLNMIKSGDWEFAIYPHLPCKYVPKDILYTYFVKFEDDILQCEIINVEDKTFTYVHRKTTPIKDDGEHLIYQQEYDARPNYRRKLTKSASDIEMKIAWFYKNDKVFYQSNDIGEIMRNYLMWCTN